MDIIIIRARFTAEYFNRTDESPETVFPPPCDARHMQALRDWGVDVDNTSSPSFQVHIYTYHIQTNIRYYYLILDN